MTACRDRGPGVMVPMPVSRRRYCFQFVMRLTQLWGAIFTFCRRQQPSHVFGREPLTGVHTVKKLHEAGIELSFDVTNVVSCLQFLRILPFSKIGIVSQRTKKGFGSLRQSGSSSFLLCGFFAYQPPIGRPARQSPSPGTRQSPTSRRRVQIRRPIHVSRETPWVSRRAFDRPRYFREWASAVNWE